MVSEVAAGVALARMGATERAAVEAFRHVQDFEAYHEPQSRATGFYREMRVESVRL